MKKIFENFGFKGYVRGVLAVLSMLVVLGAGNFARAANDTTTLNNELIGSSGTQTINISSSIDLGADLSQQGAADLTILGSGFYLDGQNTRSGFLVNTGGVGQTLTIGNGLTLKKFKSYVSGGAIYNYVTSSTGNATNTLTIRDNVKFLDNTTTNSGGGAGNGGAIYNGVYSQNHDATNTLTIDDNVKFSGNTATGDGGAIYNYASSNAGNATNTLIIGTGATFSGNTATGNGGAIYNSAASNAGTASSVIEINAGSTFDNNIAGGSGGAIYVNSSLAGAISNSTFSYNTAGNYGGAIYVNTDLGLTGAILNSNFSNNTANYGGAIFVNNDLIGNISNSIFSNNTGYSYGGAIYTSGNFEGNIINSTFSNNTSTHGFTGVGGAIYTAGTLSGDISYSTFSGNTANYGGAIWARTLSGDISYSNFSGNTTIGDSGAIYATTFSGAISNSIFSGNMAGISGGAIYAYTLSGNISNSTFSGNTASYNGGAIFAGTLSGTITNSTFSGNMANYDGGAIYVNNDLTGAISNSTFSNNTATYGSGGAIYVNNDLIGTISNSTFSGNTANYDGGAIYARFDGATIEDTNFINNTAGSGGGAIYAVAGSDFTIFANNKDVVFSGNTAGGGPNDIYLNSDPFSATLNLNTNPNRWIYFGGGIETEGSGATITQNGNVWFDAPINYSSGIPTYYFNQGTLKLGKDNYLDGANLLLGGTGGGSADNCFIDLRNGALGIMNPQQLTIWEDTNLTLGIDADLISGQTDKLSTAAFNARNNNLNIAFVPNIINDREGTTSIALTNLLSGDIISNATTSYTNSTAMGRILTYNVGVNAAGDALNFTQTGFNPAILTSPVAATAGTIATQMNTFREAFNNMDRLMLMNRNTRFALKNQNRVAISEGGTNTPFSLYTSKDEGSMWYRPHVSIERVNLKGINGSVNNTTYGAYFGGDTSMKELKNGWDVVHSAYGGYTGAHQTYKGIGNYQNGATFGASSTFYKKDFFAGLTANVGYMNNQASTMYGNDDFNTINSGIAAKLGNNFEYKRLIMQPSMLFGYTFVKTFDYTTTSGVDVKSDPLHAIILQPGVKFIANTESGWQPYIGTNVVWNIMGKSKVRANDIYLPELSIKPYVQYGVGIQKAWNERFSCFLQAMVRSGGRTGIDFSAGLNIAVGKDPKKRDAL